MVLPAQDALRELIQIVVEAAKYALTEHMLEKEQPTVQNVRQELTPAEKRTRIITSANNAPTVLMPAEQEIPRARHPLLLQIALRIAQLKINA